MVAIATRLGAYEMISALGAGGMGEVWRARDTRLSREVAIKVLPASFANDTDRLLRFEQEARATSALNHPNIVTIHELGEVEAGRFIVMELVDGRTLRALIDEGVSLDALEGWAARWPRRWVLRMRRALHTATSSPRTSWCAMTAM